MPVRLRRISGAPGGAAGGGSRHARGAAGARRRPTPCSPSARGRGRPGRTCRMPSLSFSTAIGVLVVHPAEAFSSRCDAAARPRARPCPASAPASARRRCSASSASSSGLIVSRSQPASCDDLLDPAEAGAHHLRAVAELLEVVVDARAPTARPGSSSTGISLPRVLPVLVVDAADERRDERDAGLGAGHGLREAEEQRQVAVDALALELARRRGCPPRWCRS